MSSADILLSVACFHTMINYFLRFPGFRGVDVFGILTIHNYKGKVSIEEIHLCSKPLFCLATLDMR